MDEKPVWAFVAHKPGRIGGVISPELGKKQVSKFCGDFAAKGYSITPVYDREQYNAMLAEI
jgi:hypothetical protein